MKVRRNVMKSTARGQNRVSRKEKEKAKSIDHRDERQYHNTPTAVNQGGKKSKVGELQTVPGEVTKIEEAECGSKRTLQKTHSPTNSDENYRGTGQSRSKGPNTAEGGHPNRVGEGTAK